ncbi:Phosphoribulokinase [Abeliophyllum distichum]|uniref:Phosphoribulokinase n=1 Tax=Abeliophyllum distichum TaxID=126358 RepID=A0ABD1UTA9_9LAMI
MATLGDIGVSAVINILGAFAFLLAFALLRTQPINDRVYFLKWEGLKSKIDIERRVKYFKLVYLFDDDFTISWIPCGRKLTCSYPGIKSTYDPKMYLGHEVSVLEMDGQFDILDKLIYVESNLSNISTKFYGKITQQMLKHADFPGNNNSTGLFQTIIRLKIRDCFEQIVARRTAGPLQAKKA